MQHAERILLCIYSRLDEIARMLGWPRGRILCVSEMARPVTPKIIIIIYLSYYGCVCVVCAQCI